MRELNYENQGTNTYLVYEIKETDAVDSMSLGMLTNNRINGLAQTIFTQMDSSKYIKFNVSAKVSVAQFFMGAVNKKRLLGVFKGIADAILASEDYMLDVNNMLLDLDYIFTDVSTCETVLLCLPVMDEDCAIVDMRSFFRNIMFSTQFDQTENCDYVARLINYLNSTPIFSMADFRELVVSLLNGESAQPVEQPVQPTPQPAQQTPQVAQQPAPQPVVQPTSQVVAQPIQQPVSQPVAQPKIEIPKPQTIAQNVAQPVMNTSEDKESAEPQMTMMGLLRNFSKENMALYKAQKEAQKAAPKPEKVKDKKEKKEKKEKVKTVSSPNAGFAIPGQAPSTPMASEIAKQSVVTPQQPKVSTSVGSTMKATQAPVFKPSSEKTQEQPVVSQPVVQPVTSSPAMMPTQMVYGGAGFGETTVLGTPAIGETTVLSQVQNPMQPVTPYLLRNKSSEKILLTKPSFRIGKEKSFVDYFIADNTAISRCHAQIVNHDGAYYVVDTNSTNHTFVNGMMINSNEEVKLSDGDKVRLANEDFEFHLR